MTLEEFYDWYKANALGGDPLNRIDMVQAKLEAEVELLRGAPVSADPGAKKSTRRRGLFSAELDA